MRVELNEIYNLIEKESLPVNRLDTFSDIVIYERSFQRLAENIYNLIKKKECGK